MNGIQRMRGMIGNQETKDVDGTTITITPGGEMRFVYSDELRDLLLEGEAAICRASHVEPRQIESIEWTADLSMVGGPVLGPFPTREQAVSEEVMWLRRHHL